MPRHRESRPIDERVAADRPISADLLAAAAGVPLAPAEHYRSAWFKIAEDFTGRGLVLVYDEFVVGRPDPLLLEAAHHVRLIRRAEHLGGFDDEEAEWYDEHADDPDAQYERPTLSERVLQVMADGQEADRLAPGSALTSIMARVLRPEREDLYTLVRLGLTLERLVVELAGAIRIGDGAVVDARLPGERADGWRWAA
jgi:hypothetical protein